MGINATLFGQFITFLLFILFTMKFVWPHVTKAMQERQKQIADGLAAAERGSHELELAQQKAVDEIHKAKEQASQIIEQANKRATEMVEQAKADAREQGEREKATIRSQIEQEVSSVRKELRKEVTTLALAGASKILEREVDAKAHEAMLNELAQQL